MADLEKNYGLSRTEVLDAIRRVLRPKDERFIKNLPHRWSMDYTPSDPIGGKGILPRPDKQQLRETAVRKGDWKDLYFHYPRGKDTAEFKTMGRGEQFKTVAKFYPDPVWWPKKGVLRPRWSDWLDVALIELATGIRVSHRRSEYSKEPICQANVAFYNAGEKRIPLVQAVSTLPWVKRYKGRYVRAKARKMHNGVKVPWEGKKKPKAVWMFGLLDEPSKITVFSLMFQANTDHPIAFFRAIKEYECAPPLETYLVFEQIYHDFLLELMALSLLYEDNVISFYQTLRTILNSGIVPVALFKTGKLFPVRYEEARRKSQEIVVKALGLKSNN